MLIVNPDERATINDVVDYSKKQLEIIESKILDSAGVGNKLTAVGQGALRIGERLFLVLSVLEIQFAVISETSLVLKNASILTNKDGKIIRDLEGNIVLSAPLVGKFFILDRDDYDYKLSIEGDCSTDIVPRERDRRFAWNEDQFIAVGIIGARIRGQSELLWIRGRGCTYGRNRVNIWEMDVRGHGVPAAA